jgi:hypothetical protein
MTCIDQTEMLKLAKGLSERNIDYSVRSFLDGIQIICEDWDAICHKGSIGHENGLIEVMGLAEDVVGYLTANEVLDMIDYPHPYDLEKNHTIMEAALQVGVELEKH